jgi:hypothetical protein
MKRKIIVDPNAYTIQYGYGVWIDLGKEEVLATF